MGVFAAGERHRPWQLRLAKSLQKNRDDSFHLMWRNWFDQSLILLSTPAMVNEKAFLTPFESHRLVIGRQDIKK